MKRREFITLIGGAAITSPLTASAQQRAMPLLGLLSGADPLGYAPQLEGFRLGLRDHGFVEGQTIKIEYRWKQVRSASRARC
jgi:putative ABC transport system substrate-binding protein